MYAYFIDISQGSVETHLWSDHCRIFYSGYYSLFVA